MLNAIIVDDEQNSRELLNNLISRYTQGVNILGEADSVRSGIDLINQTKPDIVFLDIEMPGGDAFDLLSKFKESNFLTCIVSGYDKYAIKAIKYGAFDYILKPLEITELQSCIRKAIIHRETQKPSQYDSLILQEADNYWVIDIEDIICVEAADNYVTIHVENDRQIISSKTLSYFESVLPTELFNRIHKSHIINVSKIISIQDGRSPLAILKCGRELNVATRRKKEFFEHFRMFQS